MAAPLNIIIHNSIAAMIRRKLTPVMLAYRGSYKHGTVVPDGEFATDDIDLIGAYAMNRDDYFSLVQPKTIEIKDNDLDIVLYEIGTLVSMMAKGNPNVFPLVYELKPLISSAAWARAIGSRYVYNSMAVFNSFLGYSISEKNRMVEHTPTNLGYLGERRRELVKKFGYDIKHAGHLIRLRRMLVEYMETGKMEVDRSGIDASDFIAIKMGEWSLDQVNQEADRLLLRLNELEKANPMNLPKAADSEMVRKLRSDVVRIAIGGLP